MSFFSTVVRKNLLRNTSEEAGLKMGIGKQENGGKVEKITRKGAKIKGGTKKGPPRTHTY